MAKVNRMGTMVGVVGKRGTTLRYVTVPTEILSLPKSLTTGKFGGTCHICQSKMPARVGIKNGKRFHFYTCPKCKKLFHYE